MAVTPRLIKLLPILLFVGLLNAKGQCYHKDSLKRVLNIPEEGVSDEVLLKKITILVETTNRIKNCPAENDSLQAYLLRRIGICYFRLDDYINAISFTNRSIDFVKSNLSKSTINKGDIVEGYYALQIYYDSLKQDNSRMIATDSCIYYDSKYSSNNFYTCALLYEKVNHLFKKGDYELCIAFSVEGEEYTRKFFSSPAALAAYKSDTYRKKDSLAYAMAFLNSAIGSLLFLNKIPDAEKFLNNKKKHCLKAENKEALGAYYTLMAYVSTFKEDYSNAHCYYEKAYSAELNAGFKKGCAQTLGRLGDLQNTRFGRTNQAWKTLGRALVYADRADSLFILNKMANVLVARKSYDSAFAYFANCFSLIAPTANENSLSSDSLFKGLNFRYFSEFLVDLTLDKGDAYLNYFKNKRDLPSARTAINIYKAADKLLTRMRAEMVELQSSLTWRNNTRRLYEHAISVCYEAGLYEEAFYFFENSRAALLNDHMNEQRLVNEGDIMRLAQIKRNILRLKQSNATGSKTKDIQKEIFSNTQDLNRLIETLKQDNPLYYQSFLDTSFIRVEDVRNSILGKYAAFVEIYNGDSVVFVMTITKNNVVFNKIDKNSFDSLSNIYLTLLSSEELLNSNFSRFVETSARIYRLLFDNTKIPSGRIIVSQAGIYIPMESLVVERDKERPVYFILNHSLSYTYSARYFLNSFSPSRSSYRNFMGMAPINYNYNSQLVSLKESDLSLQRIGTNFKNPNIRISERANRSAFISEFPNYKIVQLYTHSSDTSANGEPVIWFADSALFLSELIGEKKPITRLIVLSACLTGKGKLFRGEGVFSFNRAFATLGIPSAVTNLWSVNSKSTYELTELFYNYLAKGDPTDIALQKAKLTFLERDEQSLPFYWAAPILVGKAEVIELSKLWTWKWIAIALCLAGISLWGWRKWNGKKTSDAIINNK